MSSIKEFIPDYDVYNILLTGEPLNDDDSLLHVTSRHSPIKKYLIPYLKEVGSVSSHGIKMIHVDSFINMVIDKNLQPTPIKSNLKEYLECLIAYRDNKSTPEQLRRQKRLRSIKGLVAVPDDTPIEPTDDDKRIEILANVVDKIQLEVTLENNEKKQLMIPLTPEELERIILQETENNELFVKLLQPHGELRHKGFWKKQKNYVLALHRQLQTSKNKELQAAILSKFTPC